MSAVFKSNLALVVMFLASTLVFGQADGSSTAPTPIAQPSTSQQPSAQLPVKLQPQRSVADAARASRESKESTSSAKIYRNKDVKAPASADGSPTEIAGAAAQSTVVGAPSQPGAQAADEQVKKDRAFEAQAAVFKSQMVVEKGKVVDIQNRLVSLKYQFDSWSMEYAQDSDAPACWTSAYNSPYYKDWCDTGRNLKAQYDATQVQLKQEKARLEKMQESIRRKGYGNAVYDPD
jgi:hypothetical protein